MTPGTQKASTMQRYFHHSLTFTHTHNNNNPKPNFDKPSYDKLNLIHK